ncbi:transposase [Mesorhizobium sp. M1396]
MAVDTDGRLLMVDLTPADISDSAGAQMIFEAIRKRWPWIKHLFADGGYDRRELLDKAALLDFVVEVPHRHQARLQGAAQALSGRANLRLAHTLTPPGARLRTTHRRLRNHDPRRHGQSLDAQNQPLNQFPNGL